MAFAVRYLVPVFIACACLGAPLSSGHAQSSSECPRIGALKEIKQAAIDSDALVEPVHLKDGLIILVVAKSEQGTAALHRAANNYESARAKFLSTKTPRKCDPVWDALATRKLDETIEKTSRGFVVVYASKNPMIVDHLHRTGCCDYCICPAGTVTQCASCC